MNDRSEFPAARANARDRVRLAMSAALSALALLAAPAAAQVADAARGRALYENHCIACHTPRIHSRPAKIAITREEVRELVEHWRRQQSLTWSAQETEDVVEYLGRTRYKFPPRSNAWATPDASQRTRQ